MTKSIRTIVKEKGHVFSAWSNFTDPVAISALAETDFDAIVFDMQHGAHDETSIITAIDRAKSRDKTTIVRIPVNRFDTASRALDFGADAIIAPMINSAEQARKLIEFVKYPPLGQRSFGALQPNTSFGAVGSGNYFSGCNQHVTIFAMIETREAFANLDEILTVQGLDGVFVGPFDFSVGWSGGKEANPSSPEIIEPLTTIAEKARDAHLIAGVYCPNSTFAKRYQSLGYQFMTLSNDKAMIGEAARTILGQMA